MTKQMNLPPGFQAWIDARKRFHLSHAHVQMARELGMNPKKLGGLANHRQEPWKLPLPLYIEELYLKRFKKKQPDNVRSIEQVDRKERKAQQQGEPQQVDVGQPPALPEGPKAVADDRHPLLRVLGRPFHMEIVANVKGYASGEQSPGPDALGSGCS